MTTILTLRSPILAWSFQPPRGAKKRMLLLGCGHVEERPWDAEVPELISCGNCGRAE